MRPVFIRKKLGTAFKAKHIWIDPIFRPLKVCFLGPLTPSMILIVVLRTTETTVGISIGRTECKKLAKQVRRQKQKIV